MTALVCLHYSAFALDNGVARTPPMGWNSWNKFGNPGCTNTSVNETVVRGIADAMAAPGGLAASGYNYVIVDDCWMASQRDATGNLQADPIRFPSGMQALAAYVHAKGLKFGLYESPTQATCQLKPGSYGHEAGDAATFSAWGVDYLKYDWCQTGTTQSPQMWADNPGLTEGQLGQLLFTRMSNELQKQSRPIGYSLSSCCSTGALNFPSWAGAVANLWRTSGDISDSWSSMIGNYQAAVSLQPAAGPGKWNDPDMLEVGNGGMTATEYRTHFGLWAMLAAPLIAGNDLRSMDSTTATTLSNRDVIAVDQDPLGIPATIVSSTAVGSTGNTVVLSRPLANGDRAVALLNTSSASMTISTTLQAIGLPLGSATLKNLYTGVSSGTVGPIGATVPSHGLVMYRVTSTTPPVAGATELVSKASGRCLDLSGGSTTSGTKLIISDCTGGATQQFVSTSINQLQLGSNPSMCVDIPIGAVATTAVQISTCDLSKHQQFDRIYDGKYKGVLSNMCLDVSGGGTSPNNTPVIAYGCSGNSNQIWSRR
ncbi:ricin-type beta-trefoil lectin domain protein [Burkholderia alba]|uniref:ricin-type beta-trefoil lectin domain protein n=1 Tax=Burkholderia alba TaxID=2683677 RepID=UPI002B0535B1|nr:ricin-type beta-trefoil lectin domain protein [Burkholderia alba]